MEMIKTALSNKKEWAVFLYTYRYIPLRRYSLLILPITDHRPTIKHNCKGQQYSQLW